MHEAHTITTRAYTPDDAAATLGIFLRAITEIASADYTALQIRAWAGPTRRSLASWHDARAAAATLVAVADGQIAGFADVSPRGYVDMMFVSPDSVRQGVGSRLMVELSERAVLAGAHELSTNASITAVPFFEHHGFTVVAEQHPEIAGTRLTNYRMTKRLL
ncbi:GNAT family N-acetyltransferase [Salinibacterium hongtaonis]|uniref:GNAT family N-acetyltransferase n=1 Tax=Homoserinimonas hongtaonis TaxID=2079791 RepID=A0A2U1SYA7_9MICO|nr:GNAT family N-acetyltransferase [Salinibacterium hongtaonis]AWB89135.1 GNAT family N-acetyltransferase [Salinibacterium hongtaonis]PWB96582.1 GNAT family N-acetyltransferase [Salinibacterium hongtaonis]